MADDHDEQSQPMIIAGQDPLTGVQIAVGTLTARFDGFRKELKEIRKHCVTTSELEVAQSRCPARAAAGKPNGLAGLQQKLGVVVLCLTLLGSIGGAWLYTARAYSTVEQRFGQQRKSEARSRGQLKREIAKMVENALRKIKRGD